MIGVLGAWFGLKRFIGRRIVSSLLYRAWASAVVAGLFVYLLLSRSAPLGAEPTLGAQALCVGAMVIARSSSPRRSWPATMATVMGVDPSCALAHLPGRHPWQATWACCGPVGVVAAIVANFGSVISEWAP